MKSISVSFIDICIVFFLANCVVNATYGNLLQVSLTQYASRLSTSLIHLFMWIAQGVTYTLAGA